MRVEGKMAEEGRKLTRANFAEPKDKESRFFARSARLSNDLWFKKLQMVPAYSLVLDQRTDSSCIGCGHYIVSVFYLLFG